MVWNKERLEEKVTSTEELCKNERDGTETGLWERE